MTFSSSPALNAQTLRLVQGRLSEIEVISRFGS
jgi:hypothetical protein